MDGRRQNYIPLTWSGDNYRQGIQNSLAKSKFRPSKYVVLLYVLKSCILEKKDQYSQLKLTILVTRTRLPNDLILNRLYNKENNWNDVRGSALKVVKK